MKSYREELWFNTPTRVAIVRITEQVAGALGRLAARGIAGHVLVFLPGAAEIRRAETRCAPLAARQGWLLLPLHGDQSPEEQDRAVLPSRQRKVILATNVAQTSLTIEGVTVVVDTGLNAVDGRPVGRTPRSGVSVSPGSHTVTFIQPGKDRKTTSVTVKEGETKGVGVRF